MTCPRTESNLCAPTQQAWRGITVSDDYNKGYRGTMRDEDTDEAEYHRGQIAFAAANPHGTMMDTSGIKRSSAAFRRAWDQNPNAALGEMIRQLVSFPIKVGLIVALVAAFVLVMFLQTELKLALVGGLAIGLGIGGVVFFLSGVQAVGMLAGSLLNGKATGRGVLFLLILVVVLFQACSFGINAFR